MNLKDSIRLVRKNLGLTQEQFAFELGIKRSLIGAYEEGRAEPRLELLNKIARLGSLHLESLLDGVPESMTIKRLVTKETREPDSGNIQLVPLKAAAGYLKGFADQEYVTELPHFSLPMLSNGKYRAFEISGESMLPLASGTVVVGEPVENLTDLKSGKTYVLVTKRDGIVYKRVFNYLKENGKLFLVSDNSSYKPYSVAPDEIIEAWAAKAYVSIQFPDQGAKFELQKELLIN